MPPCTSPSPDYRNMPVSMGNTMEDSKFPKSQPVYYDLTLLKT